MCMCVGVHVFAACMGNCRIGKPQAVKLENKNHKRKIKPNRWLAKKQQQQKTSHARKGEKIWCDGNI